MYFYVNSKKESIKIICKNHNILFSKNIYIDKINKIIKNIKQLSLNKPKQSKIFIIE